jgi:peroxiredoxin
MHKRLLIVLVAFVLAGVSFYGLSSRADTNAPATAPAAAPAFSLQNQDGQTVSLSDYKGKIVVLEWFTDDCPFVVRHYKAQTMVNLANKYREKGVVWLAICSSHDRNNEILKKFHTENKIPYAILNDSTGAVGHAYNATNTPHMFIVDQSGQIVYQGAIDDNPRGNNETPVNYVDRALSELLANQPVSTPVTKAYGCRVHYAK